MALLQICTGLAPVVDCTKKWLQQATLLLELPAMRMCFCGDGLGCLLSLYSLPSPLPIPGCATCILNVTNDFMFGEKKVIIHELHPLYPWTPLLFTIFMLRCIFICICIIRSLTHYSRNNFYGFGSLFNYYLLLIIFSYCSWDYHCIRWSIFWNLIPATQIEVNCRNFKYLFYEIYSGRQILHLIFCQMGLILPS